jgi:hypothetical protein
MKKKLPEQKSQVRFPSDVWKDMHELAEKHERSFNAEIIWALRRYIAQESEIHSVNASDEGHRS